MTAAAWVRSRAHGHTEVESAYERYLDRTRVDWLGLYALCGIITPKIPEFTKFLGDRALPFLVAAVFVPLVAIALGVMRARDAFLVVLRGRASWTTAILLGFACGAISHL